MLPHMPRCGENEKLNATVHGSLALFELVCAIYHGMAVFEHLRRDKEK